jgi:hypothetical protein
MSHIEEFWLGAHSLCIILEAGDRDGPCPEVLDALHEQYRRLPVTTQEEVQRELAVMIEGLQRLQQVIGEAPSPAGKQDGEGMVVRRARRH